MVKNQGFQQPPSPCTLQGWGVRLEPLAPTHAEGLTAAARDGELWNLRVTSVPEPDQTANYIQLALEGLAAGHMLPFVVKDEASGQILGTTRYHDIIVAVARVEIGHTWYAKSQQRTHVNTACKLLLLTHAFEVLGAGVVGWRTDNFNYASQRAIERLGAKLDGVLRSHQVNSHPAAIGSLRDTCVYSVIAAEWPTVRAHLQHQLTRPRPTVDH
jgi:RimJ/RimL family protein N-acetyltransferase